MTTDNLEKCNNNTSEESVKLISESKKELTKLSDTLSDNVQMRSGPGFLKHTKRLFSVGGILALVMIVLLVFIMLMLLK